MMENELFRSGFLLKKEGVIMFVKSVRMVVVVVAMSLLAGSFSAARADMDVQDEAKSAVNTHEILQKTCPVLVGNPINPEVFTVYRGKKVYFCCPTCKAKFLEDPEKYLDRLPQFSSSAQAREGRVHAEHGEEGESFLMSLVEPFGATTLTLLLCTACSGYFMRKKPKVLFKWHRRLAYTTVVVALCHATLVFLTH